MAQFQINTFTAPEEGRYASSHFFSTPGGVCLFDTQLLEDLSEALLAQIAQDFPKQRLAAVFITTAEPDHYFGLSLAVQGTQARCFAAKATLREIKKESSTRLRELQSAYHENRLPRSFPVIDNVFERRDLFFWKGLSLNFHDLRPSMGRSSSLVCHIPEQKALIVGDLIYNRVHPDLAARDIDPWRQQLQRLRAFPAKKIYPGHGPVAGPEIFMHFDRYLEHFKAAIDYFARGKAGLSATDVRGVVHVMTDKYPDYALTDNLEAGVLAELNRRRKRVA